MGNALSLPESATGPATKGAALSRTFARYGVPPEMKEAIQSAIKSGMLPRSISTPEQAVVVAMKGRELGLPMLQSFASIHVIQGVPTLSASLLLGVAYKRLPGFDLQVIERTPKRCVLRGRRSPAHSPIESSYSWEEAVTAGLSGKDNWKKNPADMLFARAAGRLCRMIAPDTFMGLYTPEEMEGGTPPLDAEPMEPVAPVDPRPVEVEAVVVPTWSRAKALRALFDMREEAEVAKAMAATGIKGKTPPDITDDMIRECCTRAGGPLAEYGWPPKPVELVDDAAHDDGLGAIPF